MMRRRIDLKESAMRTFSSADGSHKVEIYTLDGMGEPPEYHLQCSCGWTYWVEEFVPGMYISSIQNFFDEHGTEQWRSCVWKHEGKLLGNTGDAYRAAIAHSGYDIDAELVAMKSSLQEDLDSLSLSGDSAGDGYDVVNTMVGGLRELQGLLAVKGSLLDPVTKVVDVDPDAYRDYLDVVGEIDMRLGKPSD